MLLVVAVLWGASEWFIPRKTGDGKGPLLLPNLTPAKIQEIQWQRGEEVVHLKKDSNWSIIRPISVAADSSVVEGLLNTLSHLRPDRRFSETRKDLKEFGLDSPRTRLFFLQEGKWFEIQIGNKTPMGNATYVRGSHSPDLFLVDEFTIKELDRDLLALREKRIFSLPLEKVGVLEIKGKTQGFSLEKGLQGWNLKGRPEKKLDTAKVEAFISELLWLKARGFSLVGAEDPGRGLKTSRVQIRLKTIGKEKKEETLILGQEDPGIGLWAKSPLHKDVVLLDPTFIKSIPEGPEAWEEKTPPPPVKKGP